MLEEALAPGGSWEPSLGAERSAGEGEGWAQPVARQEGQRKEGFIAKALPGASPSPCFLCFGAGLLLSSLSL